MTSISSLPSPQGRKRKAGVPIPQPVLRHVPEVLRRAYLATEIAIRVDGNLLPAAEAVVELPTPVFVLTAWNPFSKKLGRSENRLRNLELRAALLGKTHRILPATATSKDSVWREEGLAVSGITLNEAKAFGRRFDQHAVFELRPGKLRVIGCSGGWKRSRSYDEEIEIARNCGPTLAELLHNELGLDIELLFEEALHRGWEMERPLGVACPKCGGEELLLAGCDIASPGRLPCRATALVCLAEP